MEIKQINLFPFKSLKGIQVNECEVDQHGFKYDRIYMLVYRRPTGEWIALSQRTEPLMARITQAIENDTLFLKYSNSISIRLPLDITQAPSTADNITLELWGEEITGRNITTPESAKFFTDFFSQPKYNMDNLAIIAPLLRREVPRNQEHTKQFMNEAEHITTSFQDMWPCSLMTTASFKDLETRVSVMDESARINCDSFRMNMMVETDEPWVEDDWMLLKIAGHEFMVDTPTERCPVPAVDQNTGEFRKNRYPLPALNRFRVLQKGRTPCFGLNLINKDSGYKIQVGDEIEVLKTV